MRLFAKLTDGKTINTVADRLEVDNDNNMILAYSENKLVAVMDISTIMYAHITERKECL